MDEEVKKVNALNNAYNNSQAQTATIAGGLTNNQTSYSAQPAGVSSAPAAMGNRIADTTATAPTTPTAPTTVAPATTVATPAEQPVQNPVTNPMTSQVNAINDMYEAQRRAQLAQLEGAYAINRSNAEAEREKIGQTYQQQANELAAQYERNKRNFNLQAVTNGINTGTGSQAELANNAMYLRNYGNLRNAEAQADIEAGRLMMNLEAQYQANIAEAIAKNDYSKAAALLDEYNNQYTRDLDQAKILAGYGDFSGYAPLYGKEVADGMRNMWLAQNRDLAYQMGIITKDQRDNLKNNKPINEGLDENGVKQKSSSSGGGGSTYEYGDWSAYGGVNPLAGALVALA